MHDVQRSGRGRGLRKGPEKRMNEAFPGLKAFGINADQWMTAAQDEGRWCRKAEQWVARFMAKWIAVEKVRARL